MKESTLLQQVRLESGKHPNLRLFRNNVGFDDVRKVRYGLIPGSGDLIGWKTITITPEMVGTKLAVFTSVETKSATGKERANQKQWAENVTAAGGISCLVRKLSDFDEITVDRLI